MLTLIAYKTTYNPEVRAYMNTELIGRVRLFRSGFDSGSHILCSDIAVDENFKRSGIGTALYEKAEEEFGRFRAHIHNENQASIAFHRKLGFRPTGYSSFGRDWSCWVK